MSDKRLLDQHFNPIDDYALMTGNLFESSARVVTLFDRAMLAAMPIAAAAVAGTDVSDGPNYVNPLYASTMAANLAIAFLEERARRLGIEVTP